jgi:hypothetical protein
MPPPERSSLATLSTSTKTLANEVSQEEKENLTPFPHNRAWDLTGGFHFVFYFIYTKGVKKQCPYGLYHDIYINFTYIIKHNVSYYFFTL